MWTNPDFSPATDPRTPQPLVEPEPVVVPGLRNRYAVGCIAAMGVLAFFAAVGALFFVLGDAADQSARRPQNRMRSSEVIHLPVPQMPIDLSLATAPPPVLPSSERTTTRLTRAANDDARGYDDAVASRRADRRALRTAPEPVPPTSTIAPQPAAPSSAGAASTPPPAIWFGASAPPPPPRPHGPTLRFEDEDEDENLRAPERPALREPPPPRWEPIPSNPF